MGVESVLKIVLVGEESAGIETLKFLSKTDHEVVGVLTRPASPTKGASLAAVAEKMGHRTWPAKMVKQADFADELRQMEVDLLLNVHSLFIINPEILRAPRLGAYNLHPGPLPEYAGLNVPSWAIYNGEPEHGVTLHEMAAEIDVGAIAYQARFPIEEKDTGLSLMLKCVRAGLPLIEQLVNAAAQGAGAIPRITQDLSLRQYFGKQAPDEGRLLWNRTAEQIVNHVRAASYAPFSSPWGSPLTRSGESEIGIVKVSKTGQLTEVVPGTVGEPQESGILVAAADEWVLLQRIEIDGKSVLAADSLKSGDRLTDK